MKISHIGYSFLISLLFACGNEPEREVVSIEDFMGETGEIKDTLTEDNQIESEILIGAIHQLVRNQLVTFDTTVHSEFHPLDRFTFSQRQKIEFKSKKEVPYGDETFVTPRAELYYYTFSDSNKTKNAFYNWLDCFGSDCDMIKLNEEKKHLKTPPLFSLIYDTTIVVVDYRCEDAEFNWKPFQDSLINQFGKGYKHQIRVGCGGPLNWK